MGPRNSPRAVLNSAVQVRTDPFRSGHCADVPWHCEAFPRPRTRRRAQFHGDGLAHAASSGLRAGHPPVAGWHRLPLLQHIIVAATELRQPPMILTPWPKKQPPPNTNNTLPEMCCPPIGRHEIVLSGSSQCNTRVNSNGRGGNSAISPTIDHYSFATIVPWRALAMWWSGWPFQDVCGCQCARAAAVAV